MRRKKRLLTVIGAVVLFLLVFSTVAMAEQTDEYIYKVQYIYAIQEEGVVLTDYIATPSDATKVVVPEKIDGKSVIALEGTFNDNNWITEVILPEGIRYLGDAFSGCESLTKVNFPESLEYISGSVFYRSGLEEADMSKCSRCTIGGSYTFGFCSNLKKVVFPDNVDCKEIGSSMFVECTSLEKIVIPSSVKEIGTYAFRGCSSLREVVLPEGLETISACAFDACTSLVKIELPDSLKRIFQDAFYNCDSLKEIKLPENLETVGKEVFISCDSLEEFVIPANLTRDDLKQCIVFGRKLKKIVNNTPHNLGKEIYAKDYHWVFGDKEYTYTWYYDLDCTKTASYIPAGSAIYRSKAELYAYMAEDALDEAGVWKGEINMEDVNTVEELKEYLCGLFPSTADDLTIAIEIEKFQSATPGTKQNPSGYKGSASGISFVVQNNKSQIDTAKVKIGKSIVINPTLYSVSEEEQGGSDEGGSGSESATGDNSGDGNGSSGNSSGGDSGSSGSSGSSSGGSGSSGSSGGSSGSSGSSGFGGSSFGRSRTTGSKLTVPASAGLTVTKPSVSAGQWELQGTTWKLILPDGSFASAQWGLINGKWYLFGADAGMLTGWQKVNNVWYYLESDGSMAVGWRLLNDKWYYLNPGGDMAIGWKMVNEKWYYLDSSGAMLANTVTPDGYSVNASGEWIQ